MKYIQPILYICGNDEMFILNLAKEKYKYDFDILVPYDYQRKHIELLNSYIAPEYYKMCPAEDSIKATLKRFDESSYKDFFKYLLICYLKTELHYNRTRFLKWLNGEHSVYIKEKSFDVLKYYELKRYYQTIVVDLDLENGNRWNRVWSLAPNVYNKKSFRTITDHLLEEGKIVFLNVDGNWRTMYEYIEEGFTEVEQHCFIKNKTIKNEFKIPRNWL